MTWGVFACRMACAGLAVGVTLTAAFAATAAQPPASSEPAASRTAPNTASNTDPEADESPRYSVTFKGFAPLGLEARLKELSTLWANRNTPADSLAQIRRRIAEDTAMANQLLESEGYFSGQVTAATARTGDSADTGSRGTLVVTLSAEPGPRYQFGAIAFDAPAAFLPTLEEIAALRPGDPAAISALLAAEARLAEELPQRGYPFLQIGERRVIVDHDTRSLSYRLPVSPGPKARFGPIEITGTPVLVPEHVRSLARFKTGELYDQRKLDDFREAVLATGLFSQADVEPILPAGTLTGTQEVTAPIRVTLEPARNRTIGFGLGYGTESGVRGEVSWQHRNLFGREERLTLLGRLGTQEQLARADIQRFNFLRRDLSLVGHVAAAHENPDAYDSRRIEAGIGLQRETGLTWQKRWVYSAHLEAELARIEDALGERTFVLLSLPVSVQFDGTDNLFDPTRGLRVAGYVSPELSEQAGVFSYIRADASASYYLPLNSDADFVIAARGHVGSIWGADRDRIAATRRFFAGGGGSLRGFGYQEVGPKDAAGQPLGGRSLIESSLELRWRFSPSFGVVSFLDGGTVHTEASPSFDDYRWGAGLGFRYYTNFAPIRVDFATPLDRQPGESRFLLYVSIGQSF